MLHLGRITKGHSNNSKCFFIILYLYLLILHSCTVINNIKYYLFVPCVGCPAVSKDLKGHTCLAAHCFSLCFSLRIIIMSSLASIPLFIDLGRQRRTNTWSLKQRVSSAQQKQAFHVLPSLVKMQVGRGNI